jgi:hypothetical protein
MLGLCFFDYVHEGEEMIDNYFRRVVRSAFGPEKYFDLCVMSELLELQETAAATDDPEYREKLESQIEAIVAEMAGEI